MQHAAGLPRPHGKARSSAGLDRLQQDRQIRPELTGANGLTDITFAITAGRIEQHAGGVAGLEEVGLAKRGIAGGPDADEDMGRTPGLGQQPLDVL